MGVVLSSLAVAGAAGAADVPIEVNPNRPTFATPAQTTQFGVAELEIGIQDTHHRDESRLVSTPFLVKFGVLSNVEIRVGGNGGLRQTDPTAPAVSGFGDLTVGGQWRYLRHGPLGFDQSVQATVKVPTASDAKGLGSGEADGTLMWILSRDLGAFHADINGLETWLGRPGGGHERQPAATVSITRTLKPRLSLTGEVYYLGATTDTARIVSNLWAVAFKVSPRLVLDAGADAGLSHGAQKVSLFTGLTVGLFRFRHPRVPSAG
jgi:Putative MetA-pathway of phenol degradation